MSLFDTGVRPAIDQYLLDEAAKVRDYGKYWSASSAGYCMRRNVFERLKVPHSAPEDPRKQRVFTAGHAFHDWIQRITKANGLSIAQELELQDEDLMIRGHIDDLVLIKSIEPVRLVAEPTQPLNPTRIKELSSKQHLILYDYKTQNSRAFTYQKGRPISYYHKMQLGTYMYMLRQRKTLLHKKYDGVENLTEARILKISKDDLRMDENQLLWSKALGKEVYDYWRNLNIWWADSLVRGRFPPCTCADYEGGFLAKEAYNPYFFDGEPCSLTYYENWKATQ